jgi:hypothetical protein
VHVDARVIRVVSVCCFAALAACASTSTTDERDAEFGVTIDQLSAAERDGVLALVNTASLAVLDVDAGLDARAARNIVGHRDGADATFGTDDDDRFGDLVELDGVPYVGPAALDGLLAHAYDLGLVGGTHDGRCLVISEYGEGHGNYNKAIEIYNCGAESLDLGRVGLCLVRDTATTCSVTNKLSGSLAAGAVETICRRDSGHPASNDPYHNLIASCDRELAGVMTFSGNDRLVLFADEDASSTMSTGDVVLDAFGQISRAPSFELWSNMNLRRCNLTPFDGATFFPYLDYYARGTSGNDFGHFDTPPVGGGCP